MGISFEVFQTLSELLGIKDCTRKYFYKKKRRSLVSSIEFLSAKIMSLSSMRFNLFTLRAERSRCVLSFNVGFS